MITDSNHACFAKMATRCFQEVIFRKGDEDFTYKEWGLGFCGVIYYGLKKCNAVRQP
jgi:hypothetical protein